VTAEAQGSRDEQQKRHYYGRIGAGCGQIATGDRNASCARGGPGQHAAQSERGARDDAMAMQFLIPGWKFDPKRPSLVR
jgi:hypothetical protein